MPEIHSDLFDEGVASFLDAWIEIPDFRLQRPEYLGRILLGCVD